MLTLKKKYFLIEIYILFEIIVHSFSLHRNTVFSKQRYLNQKPILLFITRFFLELNIFSICWKVMSNTEEETKVKSQRF